MLLFRCDLTGSTRAPTLIDMGRILLLFTIVPIVEMYLLISVGGYIGTIPTIACVMLTAVVGVSLLRWQGTTTLSRGMSRVSQGQLPGQEIAEGMMLAVAGALLLTPGFVTDTFGFLLLMPPIRAMLARYAGKHLKVVDMASGMGSGPAGFGQPGPSSRGSPGSGRPSADPGAEKPPSGVIIDGEYERKPDRGSD